MVGTVAKVTICLLTYNRMEYAERTLRSALEHILSERPISVHIADDGSPGDYVERLRDTASGYPNVQGVSSTNSERGSYGRNVNLATQVVHSFSDFVLMLEDDWQLLEDLNIDTLVSDMIAYPTMDCIRLGYLSHTQELRGEVITVGKFHNKYLLLDPFSPEPHVFAGHPRLETVEYQRRVGPWPEGLMPGQTEFAVAHCMAARTGVAWPMKYDPNIGLFVHIGTVRSY